MHLMALERDYHIFLITVMEARITVLWPIVRRLEELFIEANDTAQFATTSNCEQHGVKVVGDIDGEPERRDRKRFPIAPSNN
jgi:hypothetical protein